MTARTTLAITAVLLTIGLGGCSRSGEAPAPVEENRMEPIKMPEPPPVDTPEPLPTPSATPETNLAAKAPPAIAPGPDEQMLDDASATGMTARASRDEVPAVDTAPVEQIERK